MDELERLAAAMRKSKARADADRAALHAAILEHLDAGMPQVEVARATGYTRERLRQLAQSRTPAKRTR